MAELRIKIPEELEREMEARPEVDWSSFIVESIRIKIFELELSKSKALQRALLELLASRSKLTEEEALRLGSKLNEGLVKELFGRSK